MKMALICAISKIYSCEFFHMGAGMSLLSTVKNSLFFVCCLMLAAPAATLPHADQNAVAQSQWEKAKPSLAKCALKLVLVGGVAVVACASYLYATGSFEKLPGTRSLPESVVRGLRYRERCARWAIQLSEERERGEMTCHVEEVMPMANQERVSARR